MKVTRNRFFYGYWIVLVGFIAVTLNSGFGIYGFSVLNKPIADDFEWGRGAVNAAYLIYAITTASVALIAGRVTDKRGARWVLFVGTVVTSMAFVLLSRVSAIWHFYVLYLCCGFGSAFLGFVPVSVNISNWFYRSRGTMQGIAFAGMGFGGLAFAPLLGTYIIPNLGWRGAYLVMGAVSASLMLPLLSLVVRDHPRDKGLRPYGEQVSQGTVDNGLGTEGATGLSFNEVLRTSSFWVIGLTFLAYGMSLTAALQNQVSILVGQGISAAEAAGTVGVVGLFSGVGKLLFGYLCDRTNPRYTAAISYALVALSLVVITQASSMALLWLYAVLLGLGMGGWAPNLATLSANYFGMRHYGTVLGAMHMMCNTGLGIGPVVAGFVYDQTGSYRLILNILIILCCVSIPLIALTRKPKILSD